MNKPPAISLQNVYKSYRTGFWGKKFTALKNLSLDIEAGEILGYLGPNGSGKTTTFKVILSLVYPDKGSVSFFGKPADLKARERIGFLPENPYFYMYLTAEEILAFQGKLKGMGSKELKKRIPYLLELVGLEHAGKKPLKKFSRGMLQRIGIAQAMVNDPDILILDEPMSGLDPMGRKRMRDIIIGFRKQNKTVIFSSHILSDVEALCDRAVLIQNGELRGTTTVANMLDSQVDYWEITCSSLPDDDNFTKYISHQTENHILLKIDDEKQAKQLVNDIEKAEGRVIAFGPKRGNLESYFFNKPESK